MNALCEPDTFKLPKKVIFLQCTGSLAYLHSRSTHMFQNLMSAVAMTYLWCAIAVLQASCHDIACPQHHDSNERGMLVCTVQQESMSS